MADVFYSTLQLGNDFDVECFVLDLGEGEGWAWSIIKRLHNARDGEPRSVRIAGGRELTRIAAEQAMLDEWGGVVDPSLPALRFSLNHCPECRAVGDGDRHKPWCSKLG